MSLLHRLIRIWRNVSISKRLYVVLTTMAILIGAELLALGFSMSTLSAVRAFMGGESLWSKAQKDAIFHLQRYGVTHSSDDFKAFLDLLRIPESFQSARRKLMSPDPNLEEAYEAFVRGGIHPEDVMPVIKLLRRFHWESHLTRALKIWEEGDQLLAEFKAAGITYHNLLAIRSRDNRRIRHTLTTITDLNRQLTSLEAEFSYVLGEGSRWLERVVISLLAIAVVSVGTFCILLTLLTIRGISNGLQDLADAAARFGRGDFGRSVPIDSDDEIGQLASSLNRMGRQLEASYRELESRVKERTKELAQLAEENAKLYEEAREAVQMRDEFMSIASHELKTPLTALHMQLQLLLRRAQDLSGEKNEKIRQLAEASLRQGKRLTVLSEELMDLTRIRLGKLELKKSRADIANIIYEVVGQLDGEAAAKGSSISVRATPVSAEIDPLRIGQMMTNLVSNAIKYGDGQPIHIELTSSKGRAQITVSDKGPGVPKEKQDRIFERFERASSDEKISGLGLGLYITREIVLAHGGDIRLLSEKGQGASFTVELPLPDAQAHRNEVALSSTTENYRRDDRLL